MDTSEYTKKFANDVASTGVGFETNFYSSMATGKINAMDARYSSAMRKKILGGWRETENLLREYLADARGR